jgi:hypothetical protein
MLCVKIFSSRGHCSLLNHRHRDGSLLHRNDDEKNENIFCMSHTQKMLIIDGKLKDFLLLLPRWRVNCFISLA